MSRRMIVFVGPTGVGKTEIVDRIAQSVPSEIINADLGQFYTPLTLGTAKPAYKDSLVPHHLFDSINEPVNFSVVEYRARLLQTLQEVWQRGKLPLIVGGSTFYIKNIFFPLGVPSAISTISREPITWADLYAVDPERAQALHKNDTYRIERAMALWRATGKPASHAHPSYDPPASYMLVHLTRDREDLYDRINKRVPQMMAQGWMAEVQALRGSAWEAFLHEKKIIGYQELLECLNAQSPEFCQESSSAAIQQRTRQYAKRQETFWRMLIRQLNQAQAHYAGPCESVIISSNLTLLDLTLYISQLLHQIKNFI